MSAPAFVMDLYRVGVQAGKDLTRVANALETIAIELGRPKIQGHRVEITETLGEPTLCRVWRGDQLVFIGKDLSASVSVRE